MTDPVAQTQSAPSEVRESFIKETWKVILKSAMKILPFILIITVLDAGLTYYGVTEQRFRVETPVIDFCNESATSFQCYKEHQKEIEAEREMVSQQMAENSGIFILIALAYIGLSIAVSYVTLHHYLGSNYRIQPKSASQFFSYFWAGLRRIFKPILWNLIPIVGQVLYIRSTTRYEMATLLSVAGRKDVMTESWSMTEGCVWRILGVYCLYAFVFGVLAMIVHLGLCMAAGMDFMTILMANSGGLSKLSEWQVAVYAISSGIQHTVPFWFYGAIPVGIYRVLVAKKKAEAAAQAPSAPATSAT